MADQLLAADAPVDRFESYGFAWKGKVYVLGGFANDNFKGTSRVDVYDVAANKWTRLSDMPAPFSHSGFAFDAETGTAYFISGYRGPYPSYTVNDFWKYEVDANRWTKLGETPFEGGAASAALVEGRLHYIGGVTHIRDETTNWHWTYDLNNPDAGWVRLADAPVARDHAASVVVNGQIYIVGGEVGHDNNPTQHKTLYRYDPATATWTRLADAPISRSHNEASTFVWNGKIVSVGGQTHGQVASRSVCVYDPATNKWTTVANFPVPLQGTVAQKVGNQIVVTGGANPTPSEQHRWTYVGNIPI
ncbi:MAG TPA: kelch repeat-containing protein [Tepidisphaeraceae bacterium]|nr:kelch repeat-containing protein [Tepidisphaeraceae bacterium]